MNILVSVASYGSRNLLYLETIIKEYRSMPCTVDITVVSNEAKDLGPGIDVVVGLPNSNPWSLPFNHKKVFAAKADKYDLFIYSEDDTLITWDNVRSFLKVTEVLPENEIAGFLRYELNGSNRKSISTVHSGYHWEPSSVKRIGAYTFARFTNDHSACYILTQKQLKQALASGKFLVRPHKGKYDLICSAANDVYTQCGFQKVICISHLDEFLMHHLPDKYIGTYGLMYEDLKKQIDFLLSIDSNDARSTTVLYKGETNYPSVRWNKHYYEPVDNGLISLVPENARNILSIGSGSGNKEAALAALGKRVVCIPMDNVMAVLARDKGLQVLPPDFRDAFAELTAERFDAILLPDVLQFQEDPVGLLRDIAPLLNGGGRVVIRAPNFHSVRAIKAFLQEKEPSRPLASNYKKYHVHVTTRRRVLTWIKASGLRLVRSQWDIAQQYQRYSRILFNMFRTPLAIRFYFVAEREDRLSGF